MISIVRTRTIFRTERRRFARVYPWCAEATLTILDTACPTAPCAVRDFADCNVKTGEIRLSRRALTCENRVRGLLRHELGHYALRDHAGGTEREADIAAFTVTGRQIRYDRQDVQTTGRGVVPRPAHLPK